MSVMGASTVSTATTAVTDGREPRVREMARDAVTRMAFSAAVSFGVVLLLMIVHGIGR